MATTRRHVFFFCHFRRLKWAYLILGNSSSLLRLFLLQKYQYFSQNITSLLYVRAPYFLYGFPSISRCLHLLCFRHIISEVLDRLCRDHAISHISPRPKTFISLSRSHLSVGPVHDGWNHCDIDAWITGSLARSLARSLTPLTRFASALSFAALIRSLAHASAPDLMGKSFMFID